MARRDLSRTDASDFERSSLERVLDSERRKEENINYIPVAQAIGDEALYRGTSDRDVTRVLFISRDESLLNPEKQSLDGYTNVADLFDEVHVVILRPGIASALPVLRVEDNVWLYTATDKNWWGTPRAGMKLVEAQMVFADGFRPDLIVARDPFESAVLALRLGKKFERPVQIHVLEDLYSPVFKTLDPGNRWRSLIAKYTLARTSSVRVNTRALLSALTKKFSIKDLALLPRLNNYESLITTKATYDLRTKYKPFIFIMLYIGALGYQSAFFRALDAARFGLRNPRLGLIALGKGVAQKEFAKRAEILGIREQVVFETGEIDPVPYLKSANVLIVTDTTPESEEVVLRGAAAGIPMIMARTKAREDLFVDGESALMCAPEDVDDYSLKLNILMNDVQLRKQLVETAQEMIRTRFHEDPEQYRRAYRESIEQVLFLSTLQAEPVTESHP